MNEKRYYPGIDVLRFLSMMFIVTIHTLQHGNVLSTVVPRTSNYILAYGLFSIVNVGVDVFAIISGFVGYCPEFKILKWKRFFPQWLTVVFYSMVFMFCSAFTEKSFSIRALICALTPITSQTYWYFSSYFFVFVLSPYINCLVASNTKEKNLHILFLGLSAVYLSHRLEGVFSIALLLYFYVVGAIIRKYSVYEHISGKIIVLLMVTTTIIVNIWNCFFSVRSTDIAYIWLRYDSPLLILVSIGWVMLFARMRHFDATQIRYLRLFSPSVFSVYLINDSLFVRSNIVCKMISQSAYNHVWLLLFDILIATILFLLVGLFVDFIRRFIFKGLENCMANFMR